MRDIAADDKQSARRGLRMDRMTSDELRGLVEQHLKSWGMFASRVIVYAALDVLSLENGR